MPDWTFHWLGATGAFAWAVGYAAAVLVWTAHRSVANRRLAVFLFVTATYVGMQRGMRLWAADADWSFAANAASFPFNFAAVWAYLRFLATLDSPLVGWLRPRIVDAGLGVAAVGMGAILMVKPGLLIVDLIPFPHLPTWSVIPGSKLVNPYFWLLAAFLFGIIVAIDARRRTAAGTLARRRANAYLLAFGVHEGITILGILSFFTWPGYAWYDETLAGNVMTFLMEQIALVLFSLLLAIGMVRVQLFDFDARLRIGISGTTVAGLIAVAAFVGSELLEQALALDRTVPAIIIAAVATLALRPLTWLGNRVASTLLPRAPAAPDDIYELALADAEQDDTLTDAEREGLIALRRRLGLPAP